MHSLIAFEVKQGGGQVEDLGGGRWRQVTSRGETRDHPDALPGVTGKVAPRFPDRVAAARAIDRLPGWDTVFLHGGKTLKGDILTRNFQLAGGRSVGRKETDRIRVYAPRSWILGWFQGLRLSWTGLEGGKRSETVAPGQTVLVRLAGRRENASCLLENVLSIRFGFHDEGYYDAPKPALESYRPEAVYRGIITRLEVYGAFVDVDGHRTGLLHVSKLQAQGRAMRELRLRDPLSVRVLRAHVRDGKERLELDLADSASNPRPREEASADAGPQ